MYRKCWCLEWQWDLLSGSLGDDNLRVHKVDLAVHTYFECETKELIESNTHRTLILTAQCCM